MRNVYFGDNRDAVEGRSFVIMLCSDVWYK